MGIPQPQLQLQSAASPDDGGPQQEIDDEVSSFEEIKVQKKLVKEGKIEVVQNPRVMTEARSRELERRQRQKYGSTPVVKEEKKKFSLFLLVVQVFKVFRCSSSAVRTLSSFQSYGFSF